MMHSGHVLTAAAAVIRAGNGVACVIWLDYGRYQGYGAQHIAYKLAVGAIFYLLSVSGVAMRISDKPAMQAAFLRALIAADMNIKQAARAVGIARATIDRWQRDAAFAAAISAAGATWSRQRSIVAEHEAQARKARHDARRRKLRPIYQQNAANALAAKKRKRT